MSSFIRGILVEPPTTSCNGQRDDILGKETNDLINFVWSQFGLFQRVVDNAHRAL